MKKSMALFYIKNFSCHVTLATFKRTSTCGSHPDCSVGQMDQQVQPTFKPDRNVLGALLQIDIPSTETLAAHFDFASFHSAF